MSDMIDRVVEFCLTHIENYSVEQAPDAVKLNPDDHYWFTVRPDRVKPGELLAGSAAHRQKRIIAWQKFAREALLKWATTPEESVETVFDITRIVEKAVAAERERCAKITLDQGKHYGEPAIGSAIANSIRAREK